MFNESIKSKIVGNLKITDKDTGEILVNKKNAIHPGNVAYVMAHALAGLPTSVDIDGNAPTIGWMAFGNGGSTSTATLSYRSPQVSTVYDPMISGNSRLYSKTYDHRLVKDEPEGKSQVEIFYAGDLVDTPESTSRIKFTAVMNHNDVATQTGELIPSSDSSDDESSVAAFTFDEIGLLVGPALGDNTIDELKAIMLTHVTFHPVLLSANRTITVEYTVTLQIG